MDFNKCATVDLNLPHHIAWNNDESALKAEPDICFAEIIFVLSLVIACLLEVGVDLIRVLDFD